MQPQRRRLLLIGNSVLSQQLIDARPAISPHLADNQVLVGRQPELAVMNLGYRPNPGKELATFLVCDTTILDEQRVMP